MDALKFITSWPALWLWMLHLNNEIRGFKVLHAYTFRKGRLDIHFTKADHSFRLSWEKKGNQAWLSLSQNPSLPRRRVEVLRKLSGETTVTGVKLLGDDRLLRIDFDNSQYLVFGFFPEALNVYSFKPDTFIESFLKQEKPIHVSGTWLGVDDPIPAAIPGQSMTPAELMAAGHGLSLEPTTGELQIGQHEGLPVLSISELMFDVLKQRQKPKMATSVSLDKIGKTVLKRWKHKLQKVEQELVEARRWSELKRDLQGLQIAQAMRLPMVKNELFLPEALSPDGTAFTLRLDPGTTMVQAIESTAKKIRKSRVKMDQLQEILPQIRVDIHALELALQGEDLKVLHQFLQEHGEVIDAQGQQQSQRKPYKKYLSPSGFDILVGRSSSDNDTLSFSIANKNDWWFHARQVRGSHVILRTGNQIPQRVDIVAAAEHAARNSKAKHSGLVVVQYCQRKHLSKPKGSHPGAVLVQQEQSITIKLDS